MPCLNEKWWKNQGQKIRVKAKTQGQSGISIEPYRNYWKNSVKT